MRLDDVELTILVKGRPITEYPHQNQTFVEGRAGSEYEIEVRNHSYARIEAVISVDGLSVIDGKPAGQHSQGYLIDGRGVIRTPGWMVNSATVAKFAFAGKQQSYTAESGSDTRNNGVIGVMAFREKVRWAAPLITATPSWPGYTPSSPTWYNHWSGVSNSVGLNNLTLNSASLDSMGGATASRGGASATCGMSLSASAPVEQSLGTAFGDATAFATQTVAFERGLIMATLLCFYDERRGLKARGIRMERRAKPVPVAPQAFPVTGCQPPPGWKP